MKMGILHVTTTKKPPYRTRINTRSPWLAEMGFVYGAPVFAVSEQDGVTLALRNQNNGNEKLIHVGLWRDKPCIMLNFSNHFLPNGLSHGDSLAAKFDYGMIEAKKLPDAKKYYLIGLRHYGAFLQLSGSWLNEIGFIPDTAVTVSVNGEGITFNAWNDVTASYGEIVKYARARKCQIIQPTRNQHITVMDIPCYILNGAGFINGDICGVHYEHGIIKLFKPDLKTLGF